MILFEADDPLVLNGTYDREGYKPGERERIAKAHARQQALTLEDLMVKKKSTKKTPKKKTTPRYKNTRANGHTAKWSGAEHRRATTHTGGARGGKTDRLRGPRSQALPGMSQVRDAKMDEICESIGEGLDGINSATDQVNEGKSAAMQRLTARGLSSYRHAGVRVSLIPGADKISVKREKDREVNLSTTAGETTQVTDHEEPGALEDVDGDLAGAADLT